jgi:hypothetical protein
MFTLEMSMSKEVNNKYEDLTMEEEFYDFDINDPDLTPAQLDYITDMILKADVRAGNRIHHKNPILFKEHMRTRYKREIYTKVGIPDPSIQQGYYNRTHPDGRKVNSEYQRKVNGASFYR